MPCSCRRCTSRSRVRADVMPIPLKREPSTAALLELEPALDFGERGMPGQVDLQRRDRRETRGDRVKVGARTGVLTGARRADPKHILTARVLRAHDRLAAMP